MSQLHLNKISREIIQHAEEALVPEKGLPRMVDDFFLQRLKQDEMEHADVDGRLYEGLRNVVKQEVLPLYAAFRQQTARLRERRQKRKLWQFVLGTVVACEFAEMIATRGRSILPQVLIPTAILYTLIGFIIYTATQYFDDLQVMRARKRLEKSIANLEDRVRIDADYDNRRQMLDSDILRAEAVEILSHYDKPAEFWRDYRKARLADPTLPAEIVALQLPAFERFLKFHADSQFSSAARQHRFNRLFVEAHEVLVSRDREHYVIDQLKSV
jgi:hypothetical protein